ncbi:hypothetical protein D3C79_829580 [compost metagenome]
MLAKYLIEQPAGGLDLPQAFLRRRIPAKHQPGNLRDLAKTAQCHFSCIEAGQHILQQVFGTQRLWQVRCPVHVARAEQFEPVVIDGNRNRKRLHAAHSPGNQVGQAKVGHASGERVQEQVPTLARLEGLGQQRAGGGQRRP